MDVVLPQPSYWKVFRTNGTIWFLRAETVKLFAELHVQWEYFLHSTIPSINRNNNFFKTGKYLQTFRMDKIQHCSRMQDTPESSKLLRQTDTNIFVILLILPFINIATSSSYSNYLTPSQVPLFSTTFTWWKFRRTSFLILLLQLFFSSENS